MNQMIIILPLQVIKFVPNVL